MSSIMGRNRKGTKRFASDRTGAAEIIGDILLVAMSVMMVSLLALQLSSVQNPSEAKRADLMSATSAAQGSSGKALPVKANEASTETTATRQVKQELDQDAFLQLLVCQMQNQDPLAPTDNTQMIAQLAQFSALEQMNNLNKSFETLRGEVDQLNFVSAGALVGRGVAGVDANGTLREGKVDRVFLDSGNVYLMVDGTPVAMDNVQRIEGS
jgi:flagellar basal-body rod modification protein FlgD